MCCIRSLLALEGPRWSSGGQVLKQQQRLGDMFVSTLQADDPAHCSTSANDLPCNPNPRLIARVYEGQKPALSGRSPARSYACDSFSRKLGRRSCLGCCAPRSARVSRVGSLHLSNPALTNPVLGLYFRFVLYVFRLSIICDGINGRLSAVEAAWRL